jgi:hypothetical protein
MTCRTSNGQVVWPALLFEMPYSGLPFQETLDLGEWGTLLTEK